MTSDDMPEESAHSGGERLRHITFWAVVVESGLLALALLLAWWGFYDRDQSWHDLTAQMREQPARLLLWATAGTAALSGLALSLEWIPFEHVRRLRQQIFEVVAPLFQGLPVWQVAVIALAAGVGEEFLFRWSIQGGLIDVGWSPILALLATSILFGLCHYLSAMYAIYASLAGLFLGLQMEWSGSVLPGCLAHAVYDFAAILYIARAAKSLPSASA